MAQWMTFSSWRMATTENGANDVAIVFLAGPDLSKSVQTTSDVRDLMFDVALR